MSSATPQLVKQREGVQADTSQHADVRKQPENKYYWHLNLYMSNTSPQSLQRGKEDSALKKHQLAQSLSASLETEIGLLTSQHGHKPLQQIQDLLNVHQVLCLQTFPMKNETSIRPQNIFRE